MTGKRIGDLPGSRAGPSNQRNAISTGDRPVVDDPPGIAQTGLRAVQHRPFGQPPGAARPLADQVVGAGRGRADSLVARTSTSAECRCRTGSTSAPAPGRPAAPRVRQNRTGEDRVLQVQVMRSGEVAKPIAPASSSLVDRCVAGGEIHQPAVALRGRASPTGRGRRGHASGSRRGTPRSGHPGRGSGPSQPASNCADRPTPHGPSFWCLPASARTGAGVEQMPLAVVARTTEPVQVV